MEQQPKKSSPNFMYIIFGVMVVFFLFNLSNQTTHMESISYDEFENLLKDEKISEVVVGDNQISGTLKEPLPNKKTRFVTAKMDLELAKELNQYNVKYSRVIESNFFTQLLSWILPALIFVVIWVVVMRKMAEKSGLTGGGFMTIGKSKAKIYIEKDTKVTFKDVAGVDEAIVELKEIVEFLKDPKSYGRLGANLPKGILLIGPPGTGKTLLARAVAGEAGVPFFTISGSEFVEIFVGVGAARVRELFEQARSKAPCIIFIDELDALGKARTTGPTVGGHDEKEQTLNQLLAELDGFDSTSGVILLAATNRPEILDPALLRAGRFDRQVLVDRPDKKGRKDILGVHINKIKLATGVDLEQVAAITPGFTGADLANLVNEAALIATRRKAESVTLQDFTDAIERIVAGLEKKNRLLNPMERKIVAFHEMGHAIVTHALPGTDKTHKISIIPRGIGALGYTIQRPVEDRYLVTKEELKNKMAVLLGGRAAEIITFDHLSTGAADDIGKATDIARAIVVRYGMDPKLGHVAYESETAKFLSTANDMYFKSRLYSEATAREIDVAVKNLVGEALKTAEEILDDNAEILQRGALRLLEKETLTADDLKDLFQPVKPFDGRKIRLRPLAIK
ncbi:MAG: ATP-dependent zinc metalloprotease FtsH [Oligoflexales bacterium]